MQNLGAGEEKHRVWLASGELWMTVDLSIIFLPDARV